MRCVQPKHINQFQIFFCLILISKSKFSALLEVNLEFFYRFDSFHCIVVDYDFGSTICLCDGVSVRTVTEIYIGLFQSSDDINKLILKQWMHSLEISCLHLNNFFFCLVYPRSMADTIFLYLFVQLFIFGFSLFLTALSILKPTNPFFPVIECVLRKDKSNK